MIIHENKTMTLNEGETIFIGAILQGMLKGYNQKIEEGHYFTIEEREVRDEIGTIVKKLEDEKVI